MPTMPIISWEMSAKDLKRQANFYSELFGWTFTFDESGVSASVETEGFGGSAVQATPPANEIYLYVQVPNVQSVLDKVPAAGGTVVHPAAPSEGGAVIAYVTDPEGGVWGIIQEVPGS